MRGLGVAVALLVAGAAWAEEPAAGEAATGEVAAATSATYARLRVRDGVSCASLGEATPALRDDLLALAAPGVEPPAVPIRAAQCLVALFPTDPAFADAATAWMKDPERAGLALVVAGGVDALPEPTAVRLAEASRTMPDEAARGRIARRLARSARPAVRAAAAADQAPAGTSESVHILPR